MQSMGNLQLQDWHEYAVTSPREIASLMRKICDANARMLVAVPGQPTTWVTGLACDGETLVVDRSPSSTHNDSILKGRQIAFETSLDNIRIFFESGQVREIEHAGLTAFVMDLPEELIRLQRREFYRVPTPVLEPVVVRIPLAKAIGLESLSFSLADISCGGVGLLDNDDTLGASVGRTYVHCRIDLPDIGVITTGLQMRNAQTTKLQNNRTHRRLGCQFVDISRAHLAMVQRYVSKRECDRRGAAD